MLPGWHMFGEGSGGAIATLAAAADPRIKAIHLVDPWGDWPHWLAQSPLIPAEERTGFLTPEFLQSVEPLDPLKFLPALRIPVRVQYRQDGPVPTPVKASMQGAVPPESTRSSPVETAPPDPHLLDWLTSQVSRRAPAGGS